MGWVRLDDNFADHPKVVGISDTAFRLYITGLCYSNRQLTDGFIPFQIVSAWVGDNPNKPSDELENANLWQREARGFVIRSYEEYQPTRDEVERKRTDARERLKRYREMKRDGNEKETLAPTQPNPTQPNSLDISNDISKEVVPMPRVKSALASVHRIGNKLAEARANGINAWNLSKLVEEEWDALHDADDRGGCIALTAWYVSELQQRQLGSPEIARIGQMTTRFGRLSLMAIDEAASKNLAGDDLLNYAFRIAQRMYSDEKA